MQNKEKVLGEERRALILKTLQNAGHPVTGRDLGIMTNVSRQVIVSDVNLLKAKNEPIIATNQGYLYTASPAEDEFEKIIVCRHLPEETEEELHILVDHGVTVKDVRVEHSVYGDVRASIMVSNRQEVKAFIQQIKKSNAPYLLNLDDSGVHLHTISAPRKEQLAEAEKALKKAGFLVE
ncbi:MULTISPECIES: transcription repressor NadR [unclassified Sporosarcina]|uniref:transcription repressor NadR n=1 Tax=unclassified Sporosarcina TaxID=2647733 RepID=UPI0020425CBD|nr:MULTISPECIES: transcription repressor NadR [unclassified Sporosarcina]GKV67256.1 transcriptional regulator [Sporosarcina sp. NCCP-2331]GLB57612.1 transcriptional regulator [Sporosarcina sp. NCCP-2378]